MRRRKNPKDRIYSSNVTTLEHSKPITESLIDPLFYHGNNFKKMPETEIEEETQNEEKTFEANGQENENSTENPEVETPKEEKDPFEDMLKDYAKNVPDDEEEEEAEEVKPEHDPEDEEESETVGEDEEFTEPSDNVKFKGVHIADWIAAEVAIEYYEDLMISIFKGIHKLMGEKREFQEEQIRVSKEVLGFSGAILDVYWQTLYIKIHPVWGAAIIMSGSMMINYLDTLKEHPRAARKPFKRRGREYNPDFAIEEPTDVEYEEVEEED